MLRFLRLLFVRTRKDWRQHAGGCILVMMVLYCSRTCRHGGSLFDAAGRSLARVGVPTDLLLHTSVAVLRLLMLLLGLRVAHLRSLLAQNGWMVLHVASIHGRRGAFLRHMPVVVIDDQKARGDTTTSAIVVHIVEISKDNNLCGTFGVARENILLFLEF